MSLRPEPSRSLPRRHLGAGRALGAARTAVEADPDWRSYPPLVLIHAEACRRALDDTAARRDWFGLCWQHPEAAAKALDARDLPDRALAGQMGPFL